MRTYLVVIDNSDEARLALRFAARRAQKTNSALMLLAVIPPQDFVAFGAVAATIADEARQEAHDIVDHAAATVLAENGLTAAIEVREGRPAEIVNAIITENREIGALVLGAAAHGDPGPLVAHFAGSVAGGLPCPVMIVPGSLSIADLDRLS
jgi:nucleotide-binding universal stress UspA family protein